MEKFENKRKSAVYYRVPRKKLVLVKYYPGAHSSAGETKNFSSFEKTNPPPPGPTSNPRFLLLL